MDPDATLTLWREALNDGNYDDAVFVHGRALHDWLRMGGFEPSWKEGEREVFFPPKERLR